MPRAATQRVGSAELNAFALTRASSKRSWNSTRVLPSSRPERPRRNATGGLGTPSHLFAVRW